LSSIRSDVCSSSRAHSLTQGLESPPARESIVLDIEQARHNEELRVFEKTTTCWISLKRHADIHKRSYGIGQDACLLFRRLILVNGYEHSYQILFGTRFVYYHLLVRDYIDVQQRLSLFPTPSRRLVFSLSGHRASTLAGERTPRLHRRRPIVKRSPLPQ